MNLMSYRTWITRDLPLTGLALAFALAAVMSVSAAMPWSVRAQSADDAQVSKASESSADTDSASTTDSTKGEEPAAETDKPESESDNTTTLTVSVSNSSTKEAVGGARVFVITGQESISSKETHPDVTTDSGTCTLADLPRGKITIIVSAQGMKSFKKGFELGEKNQAKQTISIELEADEPVTQDEPSDEATD